MLKAADKGNADAMWYAGNIYTIGKGGINEDYGKAFKWYMKAAEADHPDAMFSLSRLYMNGDGVKRDSVKANDWQNKSINARMRQTALLGNEMSAQTICELGFEHYTNKNYSEAFRFFLKAAKDGSLTAMEKLGELHAVGYESSGIERDNNKAFEWYLKAAEGGNTLAMFQVGSIYDFGKGVKIDYKKALEWYLKAAEDGIIPSMEAIGYIYSRGLGVAKDEKKANEWYKKARKKY